jgi:flagellar basal-body rod protein FlgC
MVNLLPGATSTSAALSAERIRLEVIAQNIANANTTRGLDGKAYQRHEVCFESALSSASNLLSGTELTSGGPRVSQVRKDLRPGRVTFQPGHPHANADGYVQMPNVSLHEEMADMIVASRTYEANVAVLKNSRQLANLTLAIGKR